MFCVECGKEGKTFEGLCSECYLSRRQLIILPKILDVQVCIHCFDVRIGKHWIDVPDIEDAIHLSIKESVKKEKNVDEIEIEEKLTERDPRNYSAHVVVSFRAGELEGKSEFDIDIRLKKDTCQRCGKKAGHYYEAILQLRGSGKSFRHERIEQVRQYFLNRIKKIGSENREVFISKEEVIHGGSDFYLSSASTAKALAREMSKTYGANVKISHSIAGRKDGQDLVRMTYLVRLPEYEIGDILLLKDRYYLLKGFESNVLHLVDLETWSDSSISVGRFAEPEVLSRKDHVFATSVVSETDAEIQILDPQTLRPVDIRRPNGYQTGQKIVAIVRTKKGIMLVP